MGGKPIKPVRHYGRGALAVLVSVVAAFALVGLARNPNIDWSIVGKYFLQGAILDGLWTTLQICVLAMLLALACAIIVALMRISQSRVMQAIAGAYLFILRGVPLLVQIIFWGNMGLFLKTVTIGIPFTDVNLFSEPTSGLITPFTASVAALGFAESAYMAEIIRGGLLSVGRGQREAAMALGLTGKQGTWRVVVPQALRVIVPPTGNQVIGILKATAMVSVIAGGDLLTQSQNIAGLNYRTIELLIVATIWYLIVVAVLSIGQIWIERRVAEK